MRQDPVEPLVLDTRPIFSRGERPCQAIDDAVARLALGQPFILKVPFEPAPLYAKLGHQGFTHAAKQLADGSWEVEFRKREGSQPAVGSSPIQRGNCHGRC